MYFTLIIISFVCQSQERSFRSSLRAPGVPGGKARESVLLPWLQFQEFLTLTLDHTQSLAICQNHHWLLPLCPTKRDVFNSLRSPDPDEKTKQKQTNKAICGFSGLNIGSYKGFTCQVSWNGWLPHPRLGAQSLKEAAVKDSGPSGQPSLTHICTPSLSLHLHSEAFLLRLVSHICPNLLT